MKVGDIVKIKEEVRNLCGSEDFVNDMKKYIGKQARITEDRPFHIYKLDIDGGKWNWTDSMLEKEEIKMKFKVGDYVKIKEELNHKDTHSFIKAMEEYRGKVAKIVKINKDYPCYDLDIDGGAWYWTDDMLEPIKKYEVIVSGNTITVKDDEGNEGVAECPFKDKFNLSIAIDRLKWKPSLGEGYFTINFGEENSVTPYGWRDDPTDNNLYEKGLVFETREEAEKVAKIMLDSIREK